MVRTLPDHCPARHLGFTEALRRGLHFRRWGRADGLAEGVGGRDP